MPLTVEERQRLLGQQDDGDIGFEPIQVETESDDIGFEPVGQIQPAALPQLDNQPIEPTSQPQPSIMQQVGDYLLNQPGIAGPVPIRDQPAVFANAVNAAGMGIPAAIARQLGMEMPQPQTTVGKVANFAGQGLGMIAGGPGSLGRMAVKGAVKAIPGMASNMLGRAALRGTEGAVIGAASDIANPDGMQGRAALGAAADIALPPMIGKVAKMFRKPLRTVDDVIAAPMDRLPDMTAKERQIYFGTRSRQLAEDTAVRRLELRNEADNLKKALGKGSQQRVLELRELGQPALSRQSEHFRNLANTELAPVANEPVSLPELAEYLQQRYAKDHNALVEVSQQLGISNDLIDPKLAAGQTGEFAKLAVKHRAWESAYPSTLSSPLGTSKMPVRYRGPMTNQGQAIGHMVDEPGGSTKMFDPNIHEIVTTKLGLEVPEELGRVQGTTVGQLYQNTLNMGQSIPSSVRQSLRTYNREEHFIDDSIDALRDFMEKYRGLNTTNSRTFWRNWAPIRDQFVRESRLYNIAGTQTEKLGTRLIKLSRGLDPHNEIYSKELAKVMGIEDLAGSELKQLAGKLNAAEKEKFALTVMQKQATGELAAIKARIDLIVDKDKRKIEWIKAVGQWIAIGTAAVGGGALASRGISQLSQ